MKGIYRDKAATKEGGEGWRGEERARAVKHASDNHRDFRVNTVLRLARIVSSVAVRSHNYIN